MRFTVAGKELANIRLILLTGTEIDVIAWEYNAVDITQKYDYLLYGESLYIVFTGYVKERSWNNNTGKLIVQEFMTVKKIGIMKEIRIKYSLSGKVLIPEK